jgi:uncharacterized Zn finger protein
MTRMDMDLFDYAREREHQEKMSPQPVWEEPGATLWSRAWVANVHRICASRFVSELTFGERLLQTGRLTSCRVRRAHAQATFTSREGGMVLVNLAVRPLPATHWAALDALCERCGDDLFTSDDLPDEVTAGLFGQSNGLLPELKDLAFSCSHCRHTPFCVYRAAALLAVAAEFDRAPIKLFELRGAGQAALLVRSARQTQPEADVLSEADLGALFGIEMDG